MALTSPDRPPATDTVYIPSRIWGYYAAFFVLALGIAALGPTLAELADQTNASLKEVSILFSMRAFGFLCTARFIGLIYDKKSGHPVMTISLGCLAVFLFLVPYVTQLWAMSALMLMAGIAGAFVDLGGNILVLWAVRHNVGPTLNGLHFSFGLGAFTSPLLIALALTITGSGVYIYWIIAFLCLPLALWIYSLPSPVHPKDSKKYEHAPALAPYSLLLIVPFFFLYGGSEQSFGGWIHTYAVNHNAMLDITASYLTSAFWGFFTIGRLLAIPLTTRFTPRRLLLVQMSTASLVLFGLVVMPGSKTLTWACTICLGLLMSSVFPLALAFLERYTAGSGRLTSWYFIGASSGGMAIPWIIGQFFESYGPQFFVICLFTAMTAGTICIFQVMRMQSARQTSDAASRRLTKRQDAQSDPF